MIRILHKRSFNNEFINFYIKCGSCHKDISYILLQPIICPFCKSVLELAHLLTGNRKNRLKYYHTGKCC